MLRHDGFTLIELIIVTVTIAVLAAVLIPNIIVSRQRAFDAQTQACLKEISTAQAIYHISNQTYATPLNNMPDFPEATCRNVDIATVNVDNITFEYTASHINSNRVFSVTTRDGVDVVP
ncbi:MAG: prepilin-type N-terminal cleavage/methylation domain-containing protein [Deinococcota bacterium]